MYTWWNIWSQFHMYSDTWNTPYFIKYIICSCQNFFWIVTDNIIICHRIYTFHNTQPYTISLTKNIWHISVDDFTLQYVILTFVVHFQFCDAQWRHFLSTKRREDILTWQQLSDTALSFGDYVALSPLINFHSYGMFTHIEGSFAGNCVSMTSTHRLYNSGVSYSALDWPT